MFGRRPLLWIFTTCFKHLNSDSIFEIRCVRFVRTCVLNNFGTSLQMWVRSSDRPGASCLLWEINYLINGSWVSGWGIPRLWCLFLCLVLIAVSITDLSNMSNCSPKDVCWSAKRDSKYLYLFDPTPIHKSQHIGAPNGRTVPRFFPRHLFFLWLTPTSSCKSAEAAWWSEPKSICLQMLEFRTQHSKCLSMST